MVKGSDIAGSTVKRWLGPWFGLRDLQLPVRDNKKPNKISVNSSHPTHAPLPIPAPLTTRHRRGPSHPASTAATKPFRIRES